MAFHSFKSASGKSAFGVFDESQHAGDYTLNKTATTTYCKPVNFNTINRTTNNRFTSEYNRFLFNKSYYLNTAPMSSFNKSNLASNLITKLDLQTMDSSVVPVVQNNGIPPTVPTEIIITSSTVPYLDYTIDPCGNLFGNTLCGINNYRNYLVYNPPYNTETPGQINNL
jgi:hypothetical protein